MAFTDQLALAITDLTAAIKAITARVATLESRAPVVVLTQAAYDALPSKDAGTVYVISA